MGGQQATAMAIAELLGARDDCACEPDLSIAELEHAEEQLRVDMPALWREVLQIVHSVALPMPPRDPDGVLRWTRYPDWRLRDDSADWLIAGPVEGLLFDVEHNEFWCREWGARPETTAERLDVASQRLASVPRLTPLWNHWYVHDSDDSPVFSIVQADLYVPCVSLADLLTERSEQSLTVDEYPIGRVPFWSELHAWSQWGEDSPWGSFAVGGL